MGADFDDDLLEFRARWDADDEWMDIGFTARTAHVVTIPDLHIALPLAAGEPLRFEISAKFRRERLQRELAAAALRIDRWWTDTAGDYAILLARSCGSTRASHAITDGQ